MFGYFTKYLHIKKTYKDSPNYTTDKVYYDCTDGVGLDTNEVIWNGYKYCFYDESGNVEDYIRLIKKPELGLVVGYKNRGFSKRLIYKMVWDEYDDYNRTIKVYTHYLPNGGADVKEGEVHHYVYIKESSTVNLND